jgi:ammonium transporter, Amt family
MVDSGDTAWILTSSMLVYLMTFGLTFFYGSLVGEEKLLDMMIRVLSSMGVITIQWILYGYSFAFGIDASSFWGNFLWGGLSGLGSYSTGDNEERNYYSSAIPALAFCLFQLSFAIITAALISGAIVGRLWFSSYLVFLFLWSTLVYDPICHWVWSDKGWLHELGSLDFAGGSVVHISAGFAALSAALVLGKRKSAPQEAKVDENINLLGGALLWVGWFGFNGGSALAADHIAALAFINTQITAGTTMCFWIIIDLIMTRGVSIEGAIYASVCGMVVITPACGYIYPGFSLVIGCYTAIFSYIALVLWKKYAHNFVDDTLYVFCSHGIGGILGSLTTGLFATNDVNPYGANGAFYGRPILLCYQLADIASTASWSFVVTGIIVFFIKSIQNLLAPHFPDKPEEEKGAKEMSDHDHEENAPFHTRTTTFHGHHEENE